MGRGCRTVTGCQALCTGARTRPFVSSAARTRPNVCKGGAASVRSPGSTTTCPLSGHHRERVLRTQVRAHTRTHPDINTRTHSYTHTNTPTAKRPPPHTHTHTHSLDIWGVAVSVKLSNKTIYWIGCCCRGHRAHSATFGIALLHEYHLRRAMRSKQPSVTTYQKHTPCTTTLASASPVPS